MNPQKEMDQLLEEIKNENKQVKLLLHSCCAPCSTYVLDYLANDFLIEDYFFNPNMSSLEEHEKRSLELNRLIDEMNKKNATKHKIRFSTSKFQGNLFYEEIKGYEKELEGGKRCVICFRMRLEEAARMAIEKKCDYFATTLTISPLKNAELINEIGLEVGQKYGITYLASNFKKKNGYLKSIQLSEDYNLYRQNYCGCIFSKRESEDHHD